jgi:hypothetical protein
MTRGDVVVSLPGDYGKPRSGFGHSVHVCRAPLGAIIGRVDRATLAAVSRALTVFLGLA